MLLPPCFIVVTASRPTKVPEAEALLPLVSTSWTDTVLLIMLHRQLMAVPPSWHLDLLTISQKRIHFKLVESDVP